MLSVRACRACLLCIHTGDIDLLLCTPAGAGLVDSLPDLPGLNLSADLTFDFDFDDSDDHLLL